VRVARSAPRRAARPPRQGLSLQNRAPQIDGVLGALLAKLEKDKPTLELGPGDRQACETFAFGVFGRADKVDRAGRADRTTAMTFYAASIFFEARRRRPRRAAA
jgi:vacuolar protein sorting-associated protein VTA1